MSESNAQTSPMKQLITLRLGAAGFGQHWKHCALVSNYLATFTSELLDKSEVHANLVSTVLNELLEVIFRRNAGVGQVSITLTGDDERLVVKISVPVDDKDRAFYMEMAELVARSDVEELHQEQIVMPADESGSNLSLGLLELAAVYQAVLQVIPSEDGSSVLVQLPFRFVP